MISFLVIFSWPSLYRVMRSQVLTIREKEFVLAARALGASNSRIIFREILPNLWPIAIVYLTISLPGYLAAEATYSFLGVGVQAPAATWGLVLNDASNYWQRDTWYLIIPAAMIIIVVLALNLFGDGLRDALDSRSDR
jgi:peptide/nickel transport system permease protein